MGEDEKNTRGNVLAFDKLYRKIILLSVGSNEPAIVIIFEYYVLKAQIEI